MERCRGLGKRCAFLARRVQRKVTRVVSGRRGARVQRIADQVMDVGVVAVEAGVSLTSRPGRRTMAFGDRPYDDRITVLADITEPGAFPEGEFDGVVCAEALRGPGLATALDNVHRALRPEGLLVAAVPRRHVDRVARHFSGTLERRSVFPFSVVVARRGPARDV